MSAIDKTQAFLVNDQHSLRSLQSYSKDMGRRSFRALVGITPHMVTEERLLSVCKDVAEQTMRGQQTIILQEPKQSDRQLKTNNLIANADTLIEDLRVKYAELPSQERKEKEAHLEGIQKVMNNFRATKFPDYGLW